MLHISTSCVLSNQCQGDGLLDVRGAGDYKCEETSQVCCHQSRLIIQETIDETMPEEELEGFDYYEEDESCSTLSGEGYRQVLEKSCSYH